MQYTPNKPHLTIIAQKVVQYSTKTAQKVVRLITYNPSQEILQPCKKDKPLTFAWATWTRQGLNRNCKRSIRHQLGGAHGANVAAYKEVLTTAVGGAASVIHTVDSAVIDCQPNANVEALRVFLVNWCPR